MLEAEGKFLAWVGFVSTGILESLELDDGGKAGGVEMFTDVFAGGRHFV